MEAQISARDHIDLHASQHPMEFFDEFRTAEAYCLHLMHSHAYKEAAGLVPAGRVLDLGCNNGYGSYELSRHGHRVVGVDVSAEALDDARRRFSADNLEYRQVSGQDLPFEADSFDLITSFQVIEHIVEMEPYLREIRRVLKPGGLAVFTTPNARIRLDPGMRPWNRFHVQEFTPEHLKETVAPFFADVTIRGLYASEELYATEFNRCQRFLKQAREAQRAAPTAAQPVPEPIHEPIRDAIAAAVKAVLPSSAVEYIRNRRDGVPAGSGPAEGTLASADKERLARGSIFYRDDGLDGALDLMAVCRR